MPDTKVNHEYNAEQIQVLEGLEPVRKRPGMYIGSTSKQGLHHLVYEIVDNSVDEALAGFCHNIEVTITDDNSIIVEDDGRGMPVDKHPKLGIPAVEVIHKIRRRRVQGFRWSSRCRRFCSKCTFREHGG